MDDTAQTVTPEGAPAPEAAPVSTVNDAAASLAFADSSLAAPETPAETTPAVAAVPPAETPASVTTSEDDDPRSPTIPRPRFDELNTRMKAAEESLKQYERFKDFTPEELPNIEGLARGLKTDAVSTVERLFNLVMADPALAPALSARLAPHAGRVLASQRNREPADPEPEADLQAQDGTLVYSAPQQKKWQEWHARQLTTQMQKRFEDELKPLRAVASEFASSRASSQYAETTASVIADLKAKDPDFAAHMTEVSQALQADPRLMAMATGTKTAPPDPATALEVAWSRVYRTSVLPKRQQSAESQVVARLQQQAVASTTNPATASTATPKSVIGDARAALEHANAVLGAA